MLRKVNGGVFQRSHRGRQLCRWMLIRPIVDGRRRRFVTVILRHLIIVRENDITAIGRRQEHDENV